jgi:hypothetical protein
LISILTITMLKRKRSFTDASSFDVKPDQPKEPARGPTTCAVFAAAGTTNT